MCKPYASKNGELSVRREEIPSCCNFFCAQNFPQNQKRYFCQSLFGAGTQIPGTAVRYHSSPTLEMNFPSNCKYTEDHEWIRAEDGKTAYVGITEFAQSELGELVYVEVDSVGKTIDANAVFGTVEAVKTTSDLFMPLKAKVLEFNADLDDSKGGNPGLINEDPYGKGWIVKVELDNPADLDTLMSADAYQAHVAK